MSQKQWMKIRTTGDAPIHSRDITCEDNGCRPLVVIDPEDREQVERLGRALFGTPFPSETDPAEVERLQQDLREFANPTPPKPQEPPGLGAVVEADMEDEEGKGFGPAKWASSEDGSWVCLTDGLVGMKAPWPFLQRVTVLRDGVAR